MKTGGYVGKIHAHLTGRPGAKADAPNPARTMARPMPTPAEPNAAEMAVNFTKAMGGWIKAGAPVVTEAQYAARTAICDACELWDAAGNLGLGKCLAPGCGCTKFKRWLATERCKHPAGSKWPAV